MVEEKPVWFLDVDGVINGWQKHPRLWQHAEWANTPVTITSGDHAGMTYQIWFTPVLVDFINEMSEKVDIVWLTSWLDAANVDLAPKIGITHEFPEGFALAGVAPQRVGFQTLWNAKTQVVSKLTQKVSGEEGLFFGRKVIWTDDELNKATRVACKEILPEGSVFIAPHESVGLSPEHLDKIRACAEGVN